MSRLDERLTAIEKRLDEIHALLEQLPVLITVLGIYQISYLDHHYLFGIQQKTLLY